LHLAISGFFIYGNHTDEYVQDIDISNIINNKPMYYLVGVEDLSIGFTFDYGYLGFVNCDNILIKGFVVREKGQGILIVNTSDSNIKRCTFLKNTFGVFIFNSKNVKLSNCIFTGLNYFGMVIDSSSNIYVLGCYFSINGVHIEMKKSTQCYIGRCYFGYFTGFQIVDCSENVFYQNTIFSDQCMLLNSCDYNEMCFNKICLCNFGICLDFCDKNNIHHNDFRLNKRVTIDIYRTNNTIIEYNNFIKNGIHNSNGEAISESALNNCVTKINYNNFWGNNIAIKSYIFDGEVLNISNNFWGSRDGPSGYGPGNGDLLVVKTDETGEVYFESWLKNPVLILRRVKGLIFSLDQINKRSN
jgi:parallel beta-helix repeat protein